MNEQRYSLPAWLHYLETLHTKTIELGLERVKTVALKMDLIELPSFVLTVAGTNGKGTSVALLETIFKTAHYRVGSYTSPHLLHFNERIKIDGIPVSDAKLCAAFAAIEAARADVSLTYFEFGTLAALYLFKQAQLDIVILEVGLGGRLDAVNIIDADLALITTIALDHMDYLGPNRESIGREKAGILRAGKAAVCGDFDPPASIIKYAAEIDAPLFLHGRDYSFQQLNPQRWCWNNAIETLADLPIPAMPLQNAAAVLQLVKLLPDSFIITPTQIATALSEVFIEGRLQNLPGEIPCIVDVAHNPAAAAWLNQQLLSRPCKGRTLAVIGMLEDKDHQATIAAMLESIDAWLIGGLAVARGLPENELAQFARNAGAEKIETYSSVTLAYKAALKKACTDDRIIVFGSFFTVAEIMQLRL